MLYFGSFVRILHGIIARSSSLAKLTLFSRFWVASRAQFRMQRFRHVDAQGIGFCILVRKKTRQIQFIMNLLNFHPRVFSGD